MKMFKPVTIALLAVVSLKSYAQKIATFEVELPAATSGLAMPVSVDLDKVTFIADSALSLVEVTGGKSTAIPFQIEQGDHRILNWTVTNIASNVKKRTYQLIKGIPVHSNSIKAVNDDGALTI